GNVIMPPAATSNTNHMSVFDFKGKTYFVYHNGSLPGGSGFRRNACITELKFEEDGSIATIPETAIGITGDTPYTIYAGNGGLLSHEHFINSTGDGDYPYKDVSVGTYLTAEDEDTQWAIVDGKYIPEGTDINKDAYVSIQSENKPGLYLTANGNDSVTLAQDSKYSVANGTILPDLDTAKAQTFHTVKGLSDDSGISFESVSKPGYYLTLCGGSLILTDGSDKSNATFWLNTTPGSSDTPGTGTETGLAAVTMNGKNLTSENNTYSTKVSADTASVKIQFSLKDADGFAVVDGKKTYSTDTLLIPLTGKDTITTLTVYASDRTTKKDYKIIVSKEAPTDCVPVYNTNLFKTFTFENTNDNAIAVTKSMNPPAVSNPTYKYVDGIKGKAIKLDGTYGLKLCDAAGIGSTYTISYWMKPDTIKGSFDPTLAAGTFSPQYWVNLTYPGVIWSNNGGYVDTTTTGKYKENVWQHVALTVNGSQAGTKANTHHAKLYINSELVCEGDIAADIMGKSGAAVYFGVNAWDAYFEGAIDEFAIFSRELSAKEIKSIAYEATDVSTIKNSSDPSIKKDNTNQNVNQNTNKNTNTVTTTTKKTVKKVVIRQKGKKKNLKKLTVKKKKTKKIKLTAVVTVTGKASKKVTWKSSKKKIATVSSKGVVTIKKKGTVKITATSKANKKKKCTITIKIK
ncbi:MAG: Ig-like domain-containing protein, partial [Eubacterium sp.]|nr:Ig-like domain-containing protein [Eubacterium sp.]